MAISIGIAVWLYIAGIIALGLSEPDKATAPHILTIIWPLTVTVVILATVFNCGMQRLFPRG